MRRLFLGLVVLLGLAAAQPVRLFIEPRAGIAPVIQLINSAHKSIQITMYLWTPSRTDVVQALGEAVKRGVRVEVRLERRPFGGHLDLSVFNALKDAGVEVQFTRPFHFAYVHQKTMIVDYGTALISTGNFTGSAFQANREYLVETENAAWVREIEQVFQADWSGKSIDLANARLVWAPSRTLDGVREGNARKVILGMIDRARKSLWIEQAGLEDHQVIGALEQAMVRGVKVYIVGSPADPREDGYFVPGAETLAAKGALLRYLASPYVHAKVIIADGQKALVGSINLSRNSINANRELSVVLNATDKNQRSAFKKLFATVRSDWAHGVAQNPFTMPKAQGILSWREAAHYYGRIVTVEGTIVSVKKRRGVSQLYFSTEAGALRLVVFPDRYSTFRQPFPKAYLHTKVRITGRITIYAGNYEIILNSAKQLEVDK